MDVFRHLRQFYWPHRWNWILSVSAMVGAIALSLLQPRIIGYIVDTVLVGRRHEQILSLVGLVMGVAVLRSCTVFLQNLFGQRFGIRSVYDLRNALYSGLQRLSFSFYDSARTGDLMSRVTADVEAFRHFLADGVNGIAHFFLALSFGIAMGFWISWQLTLITLIAAPVFVFLVLRFSKRSHERHAITRQAVADLATVIQESVSGIRTIKSYAREEMQEEKFDVRSEGFATAHRSAALLWGRYFPLLELWAHFAAVTVVTVGAYLVIQGRVSLGEYVAYLGIQWHIIGPLWNVGGHVNNLTNARASGERLVELLHRPRGVEDKPGARPLPEVAGHVRFEKVSFAYGDRVTVLQGLEIDAAPGQVIGILGPTGAGKSTLVQLIPRFYDVLDGRVTIDGQDVREVQLGDLRRHIGIVFQESFLFSASIAQNIAYGRPDAAQAEIEEAARRAQVHDFIVGLPEGYETIVGERGLGLSGGQKQRVAIARAILNDPRILILDDATAAVDAETEQEIQKALRSVMVGRTTFIIAHRISAVRHADEILVLEHGEILERGRHHELLEKGGHYRRIYDVQYMDRAEVVGQ